MCSPSLLIPEGPSSFASPLLPCLPPSHTPRTHAAGGGGPRGHRERVRETPAMLPLILWFQSEPTPSASLPLPSSSLPPTPLGPTWQRGPWSAEDLTQEPWRLPGAQVGGGMLGTFFPDPPIPEVSPHHPPLLLFPPPPILLPPLEQRGQRGLWRVEDQTWEPSRLPGS